MNISITINASTPEELSSILTKLHSVESPPNQHPAIHHNQPTYQQYQQLQQPAPTYAPLQEPAPTAPASYNAPLQPATDAVMTQPQAPVAPTAGTSNYTAQMLGVAAQPIVDAGRSGELITWLNQRGANALTQLDPAHYGDFATYLRSLGCKI